MRTPAVVLFALLLAAPLSAASLRVPDDYATIQAAVDAAHEGDTIELNGRAFTENFLVRGKSLNFRGVADSGPAILRNSQTQTPTVTIRNAPTTTFDRVNVSWNGPDKDVGAFDIFGGALSFTNGAITRNSSTRWGVLARDMTHVRFVNVIMYGRGAYVLRCPNVQALDVETRTFATDGDGKLWFEDCADVRVFSGSVEGMFVLCGNVTVDAVRFRRAGGDRLPTPLREACGGIPQYPEGRTITQEAGAATVTTMPDPFAAPLSLGFLACDNVLVRDLGPASDAGKGADFGCTLYADTCHSVTVEDSRIPWGAIPEGAFIVKHCQDLLLRRVHLGGRNGTASCWTPQCYSYADGRQPVPGVPCDCIAYGGVLSAPNTSGRPALLLSGVTSVLAVDSVIEGGSAGPYFARHPNTAVAPFCPGFALPPSTTTGANAVSFGGEGTPRFTALRTTLTGGYVGRFDQGATLGRHSSNVCVPPIAPGIQTTSLPGGLTDNILGWLVY